MGQEAPCSRPDGNRGEAFVIPSRPMTLHLPDSDAVIDHLKGIQSSTAWHLLVCVCSRQGRPPPPPQYCGGQPCSSPLLILQGHFRTRACFGRSVSLRPGVNLEPAVNQLSVTSGRLPASITVIPVYSSVSVLIDAETTTEFHRLPPRSRSR